MTVTARWIHRHKTANGGWTKAQLAVLGEPWPLQYGWIGRSIGRELTDAQCATFVADSGLAAAAREREQAAQP
jgi:hypothetical protein